MTPSTTNTAAREVVDLAPNAPRPWRLSEHRTFEILDANGDPVGSIYGPNKDRQENMAIIVHAVNTLTQQPAASEGDDLRYARCLATAIWQQHYSEDSPNFELCPDLHGVLSQIDNMTTGLSRNTSKQAAGEAVARPAVYIAQCELDSLRMFANNKKKTHGLVWSEPTGQAGVPLYTSPQND